MNVYCQNAEKAHGLETFIPQNLAWSVDFVCVRIVPVGIFPIGKHR